MKLDFPKLTREIELAEYHPDIKEKVVVWVNPPANVLKELSDAFQKYIDSEGKEMDDVLQSFSVFLSQGPEETRFSKKELQEMVSNTSETDPAFWAWLQGQIFTQISEHRNNVKKD